MIAARGETLVSCEIDEIADTVATSGIAIRRAFLSRDELRAAARDCRDAWLAGHFEPAHVGRGDGRTLRREIRGDYIRWLHDGEASNALRGVLVRMEKLRAAINGRAYLGLLELECHFALYPAGAAYRRHRDTFRDAGRRVVSWVLYLNEDWSEADGGELRIYAPRGRSSVRRDATLPGAFVDAASSGVDCFDVPIGADSLDIPPIGGTLVAFLSAEYEHEVLAARRERASLTGWFTARR